MISLQEDETLQTSGVVYQEIPPAYHELDLSGNMPVYQELDTSINPSVCQDSVLPPHEPVGQPPPVSTLSRIRFRNGFKC